LFNSKFIHVCRYQFELFQRRLEVFHNFQRNDARRGQVVAVGQAVVFQPKNVQAGLVPRYQVSVVIGAPAAFRLLG
ncbi:MAG: hypothetical protein ACK44C_03935, partial [Polaromonas sp.]